ncbi:MAG: nucleotidyl transferase AbiEii/AbiGii toxin family protein [Patescibacteria group bacterium]
MVASSDLNQIALKQLRLDVLPSVTHKAFLRCIHLSFFSSDNWYLAGGTALSLQAGHRQSVDLDFFTSQKTFDEKRTEEILSETKKWETSSLARNTLYGKFFNAKISLIAYPFFRPAEPFLQIGTVQVLTPLDIAAMKIVAISQRGRKRDFIDLYWLCRNRLTLYESLERAEHQYKVKQNRNHLLKSLVYFEDAEADPMPTIFFDADWATVKNYFLTEVPILAKKILGL